MENVVRDRGGSATSSGKLLTLLSLFVMEFSGVREEGEALKALTSVLKRAVDVKGISLLDQDMKKVTGEDFDVQRYEDLMKWCKENSVSTFVQDGDHFVGIVPVMKRENLFGFILVVLPNQPSLEETETFRIFSFLAAIVLENIKLYKSLEETYNYVSNIMNALPEAIFVYGKDGVSFRNRRFIEANFPDQVMRKAFQLSEEVLELGKARVGEVEFEREYYSIVSQPLVYGERVFALTAVANVTATKELEKLRQIDRMKTEFIANISHELRTPLAAIKAYAETLLNNLEELDAETLREFVRIILQQSDHLEKILEELLDFSSLERKSLKVVKEEVDLCSIIGEAVDAMKEYGASRGVELYFEPRTDEARVMGDPRRLKQVLLNLLSNAIKYSKEDESEKFARVTLERSGNGYLIAVEDNGIGIPESMKDKIFEKFFRVDSSLTYKVPGTGLGLTIAKEIVEMHGGKIWVESEEGKGSKFFVWIPEGHDGG